MEQHHLCDSPEEISGAQGSSDISGKAAGAHDDNDSASDWDDETWTQAGALADAAAAAAQPATASKTGTQARVEAELATIAAAQEERRKQLQAARQDLLNQKATLEDAYKTGGGRGRPSKDISEKKRLIAAAIKGIDEDFLLPAEQEEKRKKEMEERKKKGCDMSSSADRVDGASGDHFVGFSSPPLGRTSKRGENDEDEDEEDGNTGEEGGGCGGGGFGTKNRPPAQTEFIKVALQAAKDPEKGLSTWGSPYFRAPTVSRQSQVGGYAQRDVFVWPPHIFHNLGEDHRQPLCAWHASSKCVQANGWTAPQRAVHVTSLEDNFVMVGTRHLCAVRWEEKKRMKAAYKEAEKKKDTSQEQLAAQKKAISEYSTSFYSYDPRVTTAYKENLRFQWVTAELPVEVGPGNTALTTSAALLLVRNGTSTGSIGDTEKLFKELESHSLSRKQLQFLGENSPTTSSGAATSSRLFSGPFGGKWDHLQPLRDLWTRRGCGSFCPGHRLSRHHKRTTTPSRGKSEQRTLLQLRGRRVETTLARSMLAEILRRVQQRVAAWATPPSRFPGWSLPLLEELLLQQQQDLPAPAAGAAAPWPAAGGSGAGAVVAPAEGGVALGRGESTRETELRKKGEAWKRRRTEAGAEGGGKAPEKGDPSW